MRPAVMKVGGSIVTEKERDEPAVDRAAMERTAREIAAADRPLVLVHGAGSFGHPLVEDRDIGGGLQGAEDRVDLGWLQRLQNELNGSYCEVLQDEGVPAFPVQASAAAVMRDGDLHRFDTGVVEGLLEDGMVPVLYGTPAWDAEREVAILSGDVIAPAVAAAIDAPVLHATDVDGVYDGDPASEGTERLDELRDPEAVEYGTNGRADVSGEMRGKVEALFRHGRRGRVFSGAREGEIRRALAGEPVGTLVRGDLGENGRD